MTTPVVTDHLDFEVPFYDVDSCDVVWHGHYLKYFERARCQLLDRIGYNYRDMRQDGFFFPVVDLHIRYAEALRFGQRCRVETTVLEWENRLRIRYLIEDRETGQRLTKAETTQVAVSVETGQLCFETPSGLAAGITTALENRTAR